MEAHLSGPFLYSYQFGLQDLLLVLGVEGQLN